MRVVIGIPARMGSTRFPGKPLCKIMNHSMIEHCFKRSCLSTVASDVFVAGCDQEIKMRLLDLVASILILIKILLGQV